MRRSVLGAGLLALACVAVAAGAPADDKKDSQSSNKSDKSDPILKERRAPIGAWAGKVIKVSEDKDRFTVRVFGKTPQLQFTPGNPGAC